MPKSILDIEVNDEAFKRFVELFNQYKDELAKLPDAWKEAGAATTDAGKYAGILTGAILAQTEMLREQSAEQRKTNDEERAAARDRGNEARAAADAAKKRREEAKETAREEAAAAKAREDHYEKTKQFYRDSATLTGSIARNARAVAEFSIKSIGYGLIGSGGMLWGIDALANAVSGQRRSAQGLGVTSAEQQAFNVNFGSRMVGGDFLGQVQGAKSDLASQWKFAALGISQSAMQGEDTADLGIDVIRRAQKLWQQAGPAGHNTTWMQAHGLDAFMDFATWQRIGKASPAQMEGYIGQYRKDVGTMGAPDAIQENWQNFSVQMKRAADQIEKVFVVGLNDLVNPLTKLSEAVVTALSGFLGNPHLKEWIDDISEVIGRLAVYLKSDDFSADVKSLVDGVAAMGQAIWRFVKWFGGSAPPGQGDGSAPTPSQMVIGRNFMKEHPIPSGGGFGINPGSAPMVQTGLPGLYLQPGGWGDRIRKWWEGSAGSYMPAPLASDTAQEIATRASIANIDPSFMQDLARAEGGTSMSSKGAIGTMQLMPGTAAEIGVDPNDPHQNITGGIAYFSQLLAKFHGNYAAAAAAYNAGPNNAAVAHFAETGDASQLPMETQRYINTIMRLQAERSSAAKADTTRGDDAQSVLQRLRQQAARVTVNLNITNQTGAQVAMLANAVQQ